MAEEEQTNQSSSIDNREEKRCEVCGIMTNKIGNPIRLHQTVEGRMVCGKCALKNKFEMVHNWVWSIAKINERPGDKEKVMIPSIDEVRHMIQAIEDNRDRAFITMAYLTAGRVNEIVRSVTKKDIVFGPYYETECMLTTLRNEKNNEFSTKKIPTSIEKEGDLVNIIKDYVAPLKDDDILFDFSRVWAWKKMRRYCNITSHWMRHIRLTHMVQMYDYNDQQLTKFAGWTDARPTKTYMHLKVKDLLY